MSEDPDLAVARNHIAEERFQQEVNRNLRRNFTAHLLHGILGQTGFRIMNVPTFVPQYVFALSGSTMIVGIARACQALGMLMTPVLGATLIEHRKRVLPMVFGTGAAMRLSVLGLALAGFFLGTQANLIAICVFLGLYGFFTGMQSVTFSFLVSKVIPVERRGAMGGFRSALGGLVASSVGFIGGFLVQHNTLGNGYAAVFLVSFVFASAGLLAMLIVREPESPEVKPQQRLGTALRDLPALVRSDADYASYLGARALGAGGKLALPYYAIYVDQRLHLPGSVAWLTGGYLLAQTLSTMLWGLLGDRTGFRNVLSFALGIWAIATVCLMYSQELTAVLLVFVALGAGQGGFELASTNLVLEFGARKDLPMRIALAQSCEQLVTIVAPLFGGFLVYQFSYEPMFWTAVAVITGALGITRLRMSDPRFRRAAASAT